MFREIDLTAGSNDVFVLPRCVHSNKCEKLVIAVIDLHESEKENRLRNEEKIDCQQTGLHTYMHSHNRLFHTVEFVTRI